MKRQWLSLCIVSILLLSVITAIATPAISVEQRINYEHVLWNGMPISFVVPTNKERILHFPGRVKLINTDTALTSDDVQILNNNGFLYIKAHKSFAPVRVRVEMTKSGEVVLIDLSSQQSVDDTPISVLLATDSDTATKTQNSTSTKHSPQMVGFVTLMRYAIQSLYAPSRLVQENGAISRVSMYTSKSVVLFDNAAVVAMPIASWSGGTLTVTAILLINTWQCKQTLDPRNINGHWLAASFYPTNYVTANGMNHDRTTVFLISHAPFNTALLGNQS